MLQVVRLFFYLVPDCHHNRTSNKYTANIEFDSYQDYLPLVEAVNCESLEWPGTQFLRIKLIIQVKCMLVGMKHFICQKLTERNQNSLSQTLYDAARLLFSHLGFSQNGI